MANHIFDYAWIGIVSIFFLGLDDLQQFRGSNISLKYRACIGHSDILALVDGKLDDADLWGLIE